MSYHWKTKSVQGDFSKLCLLSMGILWSRLTLEKYKNKLKTETSVVPDPFFWKSWWLGEPPKFSEVIECLEQNIRKQIDCKRPSRTKQMNTVQNIRVEIRK